MRTMGMIGCVVTACGLLAACGHPRQMALDALRANPTVCVAVEPVSMARIVAARLQAGDIDGTNTFVPKYITAHVYKGDAVLVYDRAEDVPPKSTYQPMNVAQLIVALTNVPQAKGIKFRDLVITTNELAKLRLSLAPKPEQEFRIERRLK